MDKYKIEVEFTKNFPCTGRTAATFKAKINEILITGYIRYVCIPPISSSLFGVIHKGIYSLHINNKLLIKHPDYKIIRKGILQKYRDEYGGLLGAAAQAAISR